MSAKELFDLVYAKAVSFGMVAKNDGKTIVNAKGNTIVRNNLLDVSFSDGSAYFGFIGDEEETSGAYSDYSFVVFPEPELGACVVALGVGSLGFKNDYQLASLPGLCRDFLRLQSKDNKSFFKTNFSDIESTSSELLKEVKTNYPELAKVIDSYKTVLPAARIVDFDMLPEFEEPEAIDVIYQWLAMYAKTRGWGTQEQKQEINKTLESLPDAIIPDEKAEIIELLEKRKYVVLQGAPGTGKTWNALEIAKKYDKTFFQQFHAETTYSDFVYGIEPNMNAKAGESQFEPKEGILYQAIKYAQDNPDQNVLLIIDEINRANLSNVLGQIFYLFEYKAGMRKVTLQIGDMEVSSLPEKLHVLATMNTADRSLAVVDFALRRRFAWYTLRPHILPGRDFDKKMFQKVADIFYMYATDEELNLQPGQSYFVDKANKNDRLIYELMPLIKEYLAEGYMLRAKDAFCDLFLKETGKLMYE